MARVGVKHQAGEVPGNQRARRGYGEQSEVQGKMAREERGGHVKNVIGAVGVRWRKKNESAATGRKVRRRRGEREIWERGG